MSGFAFQHLQNVGAGDARAQEPVAVDLADVGDLVTDRCDLGDSSREALLRILCAAEAGTRLLLDILGEQDSW